MSDPAAPPPSPPPYVCASCRTPGAGAGPCAVCGAQSWVPSGYGNPPAPPAPPPPSAWGPPPVGPWGSYRATRQATFAEAVTDALATRYSTFSGRSSRSQYWWFQLLLGLLALLAVMLVFAAGDGAAGVFVVVLILVSLVTLIIPSIALTVRRLHDIDRTGWWYLIQFIPYIGPLILFVFTVLNGTEGSNQYGERPGPYL